jgi:preprotein translocase subunit SecE
MGKKAGAVKGKKNAKPGVGKAAPEVEKGKVASEDSSQGKRYSFLRLARKSDPQDQKEQNSPQTKSKEEKKLPAKGKDAPVKDGRLVKSNKSQPKGQPLKNTGRFFQSTWNELKKVHWPTGRETIVYTVVVLGSVVFVALVIWMADSVLSKILGLVLK